MSNVYLKVMYRLLLKYVAALLLVVVGMNCGHALAEGLESQPPSEACHEILVTDSEANGENHHGHSHSNGLCECIGLTGAIEAGAVAALYVPLLPQTYDGMTNERFLSRTIKPALDPPKV